MINAKRRVGGFFRCCERRSRLPLWSRTSQLPQYSGRPTASQLCCNPHPLKWIRIIRPESITYGQFFPKHLILKERTSKIFASRSPFATACCQSASYLSPHDPRRPAQDRQPRLLAYTRGGP